MRPSTVVRLRQDLPSGTIVEELDGNTVLVEFTNENGETVALLPTPKALLVQVEPPTSKPLLEVIAVEPLPGFVLRLTFENGEVRRFSMAKLLARNGTVFTPLRRVTMFRKVFIVNGTICWPGGADINPELLYEQSAPDFETSSAGKDEDVSVASNYPIDTEWENMPEVGLERWPYDEQENSGN
tara:strand:+ start:1252 stop:1803 length:552 start_codon:yes stop_codon:yes gene_type:complete